MYYLKLCSQQWSIYSALFIKRQFTEAEFNKIEDIPYSFYKELTVEETIAIKKCGRFLSDLKTRLPKEHTNKLYGFKYIAENNHGGTFSFHSNCGVVNLNNQNITTDRHGIIIFKSLLTLLNEKELQAILAHEVGHIVLNNVTRYNLLLQEVCALSLALSIAALGSYGKLFIMANLLRYKDNVELAKIVMVMGTMLMINHYAKTEIRKNEFDADKQSVIYTKDKTSLISAIKKITDARTLEAKLGAEKPSFFKLGTNNIYDYLRANPTFNLDYISLFTEYI